MRILKRILSFAMVLMLLCTCLASCGKSMGEPLLTAEGYDSKLSVNLFELYLCRMKTEIYILEGEKVESDVYWDKWIDVAEGETYNTHYTQMTLDATKEILARVLYFEAQKVDLPNSVIEKVDSEMQELVQLDGNGSKNELNKILGNYGVNYDMLREAKLMLARIEFVKDYVFGANGEKIGANIIEDYYKAHYARYKQLYVRTWEYQFVTDDNGDEIWYLNEGKSDEKISYDSSKTPKKNSKGENVKDEYGNDIYVYTDDGGKERIAYSKLDADRKFDTDEDGRYIKRYFTGEKLDAARAEAQSILEKVQGKTVDDFEAVMKEYPQYMEENISVYPEGNYIPDNVATALPNVHAKLFELKVGEQAMVEEKNDGFHIIMRYELDELNTIASMDNYEDLFISNSTGTYIFMEELCEEQLTKASEKYKKIINVDEELYKTVDIKSVAIMKNGYYY